MPGLSGSQVAYAYAVANGILVPPLPTHSGGGFTRADTTRSGFFLHDVVPAWINGAVRSGLIQQSVRIDLNTGDEPHRASFNFKGGSGFVPQAGHSVVIGHGTAANPLFSGRIIKAVRVALRNDDRRPTYRCEAAGHVFEMDQARVTRGFYAQSLSPNSIVRGVFAVTTPSVSSMGFRADYVDTGLGAVENFFIGPTDGIAQAFGRLFRSVDATWYVDHDRNLHAFGSVDAAPGATPSTITAANSRGVWEFQYAPMDLSRVFTQAQVVGAGQSTLADFLPGRHLTVPVASASLIANQNGSTGDDVFVSSDESYLLGGYEIVDGFFYRPESQFNSGQAAIAFNVSIGANTITVVGANVASVSPIDPDRWYSVGGQWLYVSSTLGIYSATAGSIAYNYYIQSSGSGSVQSDIGSFSPLASAWQMTVNPSSSLAVPIIPAGSDLSVYATRVNTPARDQVSSLMGSTTYGLVSKTFTDARLSPDGAEAVALAALERGAPSQWASLEFVTRERAYAIGRPVYVSLTSPAEPSGASISGVFTAQDITISGFGRLTNTRGPERTIRAGAVRRPTLWQILQGD